MLSHNNGHSVWSPLSSKHVGWKAVVAGWAARADVSVYDHRMTDVLQRGLSLRSS